MLRSVVPAGPDAALSAAPSLFAAALTPSEVHSENQNLAYISSVPCIQNASSLKRGSGSTKDSCMKEKCINMWLYKMQKWLTF